jgi:hypothetical protein
VLIANGSLQNHQIVITNALNSGQNWYDAAGDLIQYESYETLNSTSQEIIQKGFYDPQGNETLLQTQTATGSAFATYQTDSYNDDGQQTSQVIYNLPGSTEAATNSSGAVISYSDAGWVRSATFFTYNGDGQLTDQSEYAEESAQTLVSEYGTATAITNSAYANEDETAPGVPASVGATSDGALLLAAEYKYAPGSYDADGNLLSYQVVTTAQSTVQNPTPTANTQTFTNSFVWQNAALTSGTTETNSSNSGTQTSTNTYNDLGELVATSGGVNGSSQTNTMAYSADAQIVQKTTTPTGGSANTTTSMYANQQGLGGVNTDGGINVLATTGGFTYSSLGTQDYTVQSGETLASIAQTIYGDSNYAYIIAQANGLSAGQQPSVGMVLTIPQVTTTANASNTFQPYAQSQLVNATASACETTAQIVTASIESVLNQQSAFAQTVEKVEDGQATQAAAQAAQAAQQAAENVANGVYRYEYMAIQNTLSSQAKKEAALATQDAQAAQQAAAQGNLAAAEQAAQQATAAAKSAEDAVEGLKAQDQPVHTDLLSDSGAVPDGMYGTDDDDNDDYYSGQLGAQVYTRPTYILLEQGYSGGGNNSSIGNNGGLVLTPPPGYSLIDSGENIPLPSPAVQAPGTGAGDSSNDPQMSPVGSSNGMAGGPNWGGVSEASWSWGAPWSWDRPDASASSTNVDDDGASDTLPQITVNLDGDLDTGIQATPLQGPSEGDLSDVPMLSVVDPDSTQAWINANNAVNNGGSSTDNVDAPNVQYQAGQASNFSGVSGGLDGVSGDAQGISPIQSGAVLLMGNGLQGGGGASVSGQTVQATPGTIFSETYDAVSGAEQFELNNPEDGDPVSLGALALLSTAMDKVGDLVGSVEALWNQSSNGGYIVAQNPFTQTSIWGNNATNTVINDPLLLVSAPLTGPAGEAEVVTEGIEGAVGGSVEIPNSLIVNDVPSTGPTLDAYTQGLVDQLRAATLSGGDTATPASALADLSTNVSGDGSRVVLGQWNSVNGGYINEAQTNGGIWFQTPDGVYEALTDGLSPEQGRAVVWNVNQQFLQSNLENGVSEFYLWNETPEDVLINRPNSYTASEVNYLQQNAGQYGYTQQGSSWVKGP